MKKIEQIDKNFAVAAYTERENAAVYNILSEPFKIYGLIPPANKQDVYRRLPEEVAKTVSEGVYALHTHSAGGRVRFKTDSSFMGISVKYRDMEKMSHFPLSGSAGFDLYAGSKHINTFRPAFDVSTEMSGEVELKGGEIKEYTLNFPLYSTVREVYIILDKDAQLLPPDPYKYEKPVLFYGSSITQGGCASRPGTSYESILSRKYNFNFINLGFSGNAKGEDEIADYMANTDMSVFVLDYDHNAPTAEHLLATHSKVFKAVRETHPNIPIICVTRPVSEPEEYATRREIVVGTVNSAKAGGDQNVFFVDMRDYLDKQGILEECSVDLCHPNDLGFYFMAKAFEDIFNQIFN